MKFLTNENFPLTSSKFLQAEGLDVKHIGSVAPSITDEEVMEMAIREGRIIITFDRDYGTLVFQKGYQPPGVLYLRMTDYPPQFPGEFVLSILESDPIELVGNFTVADEQNVRQRKI